ncbi:unnamed protein product [Rhizopus stolonifer]
MQQEIYQEQLPPVPYIETSNMYKICGKFHVAYAGPVTCFIWLVINMYGCVLSFQGRSPIYSYLDHTALIIQGVVCLLFFISALLSLYIFSVGIPEGLRISHRLTWMSVILFLIDYFINMVLFGVQRDRFEQECIANSRQDVVGNTQTLSFTPTLSGSDLYNCSRLWESEMKLSVALFVILFFVYIHFAFCFWNYTQERMLIRAEKMKFYSNNPYDTSLYPQGKGRAFKYFFDRFR